MKLTISYLSSEFKLSSVLPSQLNLYFQTVNPPTLNLTNSVCPHTSHFSSSQNTGLWLIHHWEEKKSSNPVLGKGRCKQTDRPVLNVMTAAWWVRAILAQVTLWKIWQRNRYLWTVTANSKLTPPLQRSFTMRHWLSSYLQSCTGYITWNSTHQRVSGRFLWLEFLCQ